MSSDFDIYRIESELSSDKPKILTVLKRAVRDIFQVPLIGWAPPANYDPQKQFFFRSPDFLCGVHVFYQELTHADLDDLVAAIHQYTDSLKDRLHVLIFFPGLSKGVAQSICSHKAFPRLFARGSIRFLEFFFLQSKSRQGIALRELSPGWGSEAGKKTGYEQTPISPPATSYPLAKYARLSRSELAELVELGLELKKIETR